LIIKKENEDLEKQEIKFQNKKLMRIATKNTILIFLILSLFSKLTFAQKGFENPKQYEITEVNVEGLKNLQDGAIVRFTGLLKGKKIVIPGNEISNAIDKLWKQGLFSDIQIYAEKQNEDQVALTIKIEERDRMSKIIITGTKKSHVKDIEELIDLKSGMQITDDIMLNTKRKIKNFYTEKGFLNATVDINQSKDTTHKNLSNLHIKINPGERVKIEDIVFYGNNSMRPLKLYRSMSETKRKLWYNIFKRSRYIPEKYKEDLKSLKQVYVDKGFRDFKIVRDSIEFIDSNNLVIHIYLQEGIKYHFRDISWVGNKKYSTEILDKILNIKRGSIYNESLLNERLFGLEGVSSIYLDNGYLFFNADPVEVLIENDSIDIEIRVYEGQQAAINEVIITGNDKTSDHVIRREVRTRPGELFRRSDIIRTQRELAQMGYFDPETMGVNPKPNPQNGTVDIEYTLEEKSTDQVELSGGWAGYFVGSVRLVLNNFSTKKFFNKEAWKPFPSGDGQKLSLSISANPLLYQSYSCSFTEPWLGGRKPNSLTVQVYHSVSKRYSSSSIYRSSYKELIKSKPEGSLAVTGGSIGLARRLKWPDDWFSISNSISYQRYNFDNYNIYNEILDTMDVLKSNSISLTTILNRNSTDQLLYPTVGTNFTLKAELTPPYSLLDSKKRDGTYNPSDKYNWIEYHKWTFKAESYYNLVHKLVLKTQFELGFLGYYSKDFKSPFETYTMGGDGLSGASMRTYGIDMIPMRGYASNAISRGANLYSKYIAELRYPVTQSQSATIYGLVFAEAGNAWTEFNEYDPFSLKRSAGVGIRLFLPMLGLVGFDYGYGFDIPLNEKTGGGWQPHVILGQQF